ncbi:MAG: sigma-54-dependent transcriptional regulator, partial [Myxococcota bacterium]
MRAYRLLIVDDDPAAREWLVCFGESLGYEVAQEESGEQALERFERERPDLVTLDLLLPGMDGLETLKRMRSIDARVPVIILSGHGETAVIVEVLRAGAAEFLRKPFHPEELELAFRKALDRRQLESEVARLRELAPRARQTRPSFLFSDTPRMRAIDDLIDHVADTDITVLIRGESGTGKELVARTLHERSARPDGPFIKVNCAALPSELLESELFG